MRSIELSGQRMDEEWTSRQAEVLSDITHDLRAPLCAIMGYLDLVGRQVDKSAPPKAMEYLSLARDAGERLHQMVNDILDLFSFENGADLLQKKEVPVSDLFQNVRKTFQGLADLKHVDLVTSLSPRTPTAWTDPRYLSRALDNLVANAIKFTPTGGRVEVRSRRLPGRVAFEISDTGCGIPAKDQKRIFEKFQRGECADPHRGHGIGLSVAKAIIEAHGGAIRVTSQMDKGSRFNFWIPNPPTPSPAWNWRLDPLQV